VKLQQEELLPHGPIPMQHRPESQIWPPEQKLPQPPQLFGSTKMSAQTPPQANCPAGQVQTPLLQVAPLGQTWPQVPQLLKLVPVL
jgi:hypothetical protein